MVAGKNWTTGSKSLGPCLRSQQNRPSLQNPCSFRTCRKNASPCCERPNRACEARPPRTEKSVLCHIEESMTTSSDLNQDQIAYWNSSAGKKWLAAQEHTDVMLAPVSQVLLTAAAPQQGAAVLDICCGCGATTVELAEAVGPQGRVFAIDVSEPMLGRARERLSAYPHVELALADASVYAFQSFADLAISRFGVMFFADPTAAFANVIRALKPGGRLILACLRKLGENPWLQVPLHAAYYAGVPRVERPGPEDPGPFSFADPERV